VQHVRAELDVMREAEDDNPWVVKLHYSFQDDECLYLVMEYVPDTVYRLCRHYCKSDQTIPMIDIKLYMYQLCRSLQYIHSLGICHRDIKPQNLLVDARAHVLKLCDFGSAKMLVQGEPNVSYICSRYYRAPELIFGSVNYTSSIDVWSLGCVMAELLLGQPLFPGESGVDQLVEIIKVLGTPTRDEIKAMNKDYTDFKFPQIKPHPWSKVFNPQTPPEAIDFISKVLVYDPVKRLNPIEACAHPFFDKLRDPDFRLADGAPTPPIFDFSKQEFKDCPKEIRLKLIPEHHRRTMTQEQLRELGLS